MAGTARALALNYPAVPVVVVTPTVASARLGGRTGAPTPATDQQRLPVFRVRLLEERDVEEAAGSDSSGECGRPVSLRPTPIVTSAPSAVATSSIVRWVGLDL